MLLYLNYTITRQFDAAKPSQSREAPKSRTFVANAPNSDFEPNEIKSTTTNVLTFIPMNLLKQMQQPANIYFMLIAVLQMIPTISVTNGTPTILFPLSFVMLAVLIKDAYEEYYRYCKDKEENERQVEVLVDNRFVFQKWQSLVVGHVVKLRKQNLIPCDCIVVKTSDAENKCFVETKGLDGQTNLKVKNSFLTNIPNNITKSPDYYSSPYQINCGMPAPEINQFDGTIEQPKSRTKIPLDSSNLILRGCLLKNVHEVIAICCYTGSDTKVVLNSAKFEPKTSKLMSEVGKIVIEVFIWQVLIALVCSLFNMILQSSYKEVTQYIPTSNYWIMAMTWWLLMTYFIPISLMVTMEMVKLFQGSILIRDREGYSDDYKCFTSANNTSVNENLGQIKFVFTDKTGTLTKNNMIFRSLICNGQLFGAEDLKRKEMKPTLTNSPLKSMKSIDHKLQLKRTETENARLSQQYRNTVNFQDPNFQTKKKEPKLKDALKVICLCHEITVEIEGEQLLYNSSSPDEIALINFAKNQGVELMGEENKMIKIAEYGDSKSPRIAQYQKLAVLEFSSVRKRMSVIIRDPQTRRIELLTKGADSTVKQLLKPGQPDLQKTQRHIDQLSIKGLRTLMLGKKSLTEDEFARWMRELNQARGTIGQSKKGKIYACYEKIQKNLDLVGATAIEDELQDDVKGTIEHMRLAGMSFFVLTGDKRETAISIGRSCGLIDEHMLILDIPEYRPEIDSEWRMDMLRKKEIKEEKVFMLNAEKQIPPDLPLHPTICYRCTPKNKEQIVNHVKAHTPYLTMAVGDGSNDVNMIKAAHVGIGIKGKEGTEAARVADFVAGEFKFIKLLTLYYGREWYRKNCQLVNYSFYKNWLHVSCVIVFGGFSYFSGVVFFNVYLYELMNVVYSSWPIIIYALFDEEYTHAESYQYFDLYKAGINNEHFSQSAFLKTIGLSLLYGAITLLVVFEVLEAEVLDSTGKTGYLQLSGSVLFGLIIIIINLKILAMSTGVKPLNTILVVLSIAMYWISEALYGKLSSPKDLLILKEQFSYVNIIFVQIILVFFLIFLDFGYSKYKEFMDRKSRYQDTQKAVVDFIGSFI